MVYKLSLKTQNNHLKEAQFAKSKDTDSYIKLEKLCMNKLKISKTMEKIKKKTEILKLKNTVMKYNIH